jgi:hypothetical protein
LVIHSGKNLPDSGLKKKLFLRQNDLFFRTNKVDKPRPPPITQKLLETFSNRPLGGHLSHSPLQTQTLLFAASASANVTPTQLRTSAPPRFLEIVAAL